jgi:phosphoribosyl 1,2-cyclic phosphodiesterase
MYGFCPLASGSQGNAIFFGTKKTRILIDAGIGARTVASRLSAIGVPLSSIEAIIITHEHTDHIQGLKSLALTHKIPVFANSDTASAICEFLGEKPKLKIFTTGETFEFGDLEISPFTIPHDTLDPVGFTIRTCGYKIGLCTDLGFPTSLVKSQLKSCDFLYVEANHQPSMVHASSRPSIYKERVLGSQGHLSNDDAALLLAHVAHPGLKHIHLAHLSQECNSPELALSIIRQRLTDAGFSIPLAIAPQETFGPPILF